MKPLSPLIALACLLCSCQLTEQPQVEPIVVPEDPSLRGVETGVRTVYGPGVALEIFYPAPEGSSESQPPADVDIADFVPEEVAARLGGLSLPPMSLQARRNVPVRNTEDPLPVLFFSHGFAAFRSQSPDLCDHLASRGYVVVAVDHPGRMLGDLLPCIFSPALEGCDLAGLGEDDSPGQMRTAIAWLEDAAEDESSFLYQRIDPGLRGIVGHSAGGGTIGAMEDSDGFAALLPMAAGPALSSSAPALFMSGACDAIVTDAQVTAGWEATPGSQLLRIEAAGHLPFSDLCELNLGEFAEEALFPRDDINPLFLDQLVALGTDGCPAVPPPEGACETDYGDLDVAQQIIRHYATAHFDAELLGQGDGMDLGDYEGASLVPRPD